MKGQARGKMGAAIAQIGTMEAAGIEIAYGAITLFFVAIGEQKQSRSIIDADPGSNIIMEYVFCWADEGSEGLEGDALTDQFGCDTSC